MYDFAKWVYRASILLLVVLLIDFNSNWLKSPSGNKPEVLTPDLILSGLIAVLLMINKFTRRL
jgi:hypothetical protein